MMKFWINRAAEVFCKSKEIPTPLLYGDFDGINEYPWEEISEKEFNDFMQASIEIEQEEEKRRKKMGIPTFEELQKKGLTNPKKCVII